MTKFTTHLDLFWRVVNFVSPCYVEVYSSFGSLLKSCKLCFPLLWASLQAQKLTKSRILAKTKVYNSKFTNLRFGWKQSLQHQMLHPKVYNFLKSLEIQSLHPQSLAPANFWTRVYTPKFSPRRSKFTNCSTKFSPRQWLRFDNSGLNSFRTKLDYKVKKLKHKILR